ncbi:MAG TPA: AraC family transcriptional regulator [Pyrinomonadaceae bacterium]
MESDDRRDVIDLWRPHDLNQLEVRRGFSVARPVPRHWHEEYQLCLIQSGTGDLTYRGSSLPTPPTSLFIVHPGEVHSNRAFDSLGVSYRMIFVDAESMRYAASEVRYEETGVPFFPTAVVFDKDIIRRYLSLHYALEQPASSLERQALLLNFLTTLITRFAENSTRPRPPGLERQAVGRALDYLSEHYAENISLENLARIANLSPFHFNRVFSEQYGMPPHAFQTQLRVFRAKTLLRQGWSISQVAFQTGFADQSHLTRHFKRLVAVTPGQFRQNSKNVQDSF